MEVYANVRQSSVASLDTFWSASIPAGSGITATRFVIPSNRDTWPVPARHQAYGRLLLARRMGLPSSTRVRAGFKTGAATACAARQPGACTAPETSGGRLAGGHSRTIPRWLPDLPTGAAGAIVNLSLTDTVTAAGELKISTPPAQRHHRLATDSRGSAPVKLSPTE